MKQFAFIAIFLIFSITTLAQPGNNARFSKDYYLKKSKTQKTIGWVLLGGGAACFLGGGIISVNTYGVFTDKIGFWDYVSMTGLVAMPVSIPFFVSAHHNKKRAASIAITNQKILRQQKNNTGFIAQPAFTLSISL